jgi:hypothetical protein
MKRTRSALLSARIGHPAPGVERAPGHTCCPQRTHPTRSLRLVVSAPAGWRGRQRVPETVGICGCRFNVQSRADLAWNIALGRRLY